MMKGYGEVVSNSRLKDGVVEGFREQLACARWQRDLDDPGITSYSIYLSCSRLGILSRHRHRAAQPVVLQKPSLQQPVVVGGSQSRRELGLDSHVGGLDGANEYCILDLVGVKKLIAHQLITRASRGSVLDNRLGHRETGHLRVRVGEPIDACKA